VTAEADGRCSIPPLRLIEASLGCRMSGPPRAPEECLHGGSAVGDRLELTACNGPAQGPTGGVPVLSE